MEMPGSDALAFVTGQPQSPLPMRLSCAGVDVDVTGLPAGTAITINFMHYPQMRCTLNGQPVALGRDGWQRIFGDVAQVGLDANPPV